MSQDRSPGGRSRARVGGSPRSAGSKGRETLSDLRHRCRPGGLVHWIQAQHAVASRAWEVGVLVDVRGFEALVEFPGLDRPRRFGTLWPDALTAAARRRTVARRADGRPYVLWNDEFHVLMFDQGGSNAIFNLVDFDRHPEIFEHWQRLAAADPDWATRPAPPDAPAGVWRAIFIADPPRATG